MGLCFVIVNVKLTFVFIGEKEPLRAFGRCQGQGLGRTVAFAKIQNVSKRRNKRAKSFTRSGVEVNDISVVRGEQQRVGCFENNVTKCTNAMSKVPKGVHDGAKRQSFACKASVLSEGSGVRSIPFSPFSTRFAGTRTHILGFDSKALRHRPSAFRMFRSLIQALKPVLLIGCCRWLLAVLPTLSPKSFSFLLSQS
jgi:hypothetical protein